MLEFNRGKGIFSDSRKDSSIVYLFPEFPNFVPESDTKLLIPFLNLFPELFTYIHTFPFQIFFPNSFPNFFFPPFLLVIPALKGEEAERDGCSARVREGRKEMTKGI